MTGGSKVELGLSLVIPAYNSREFIGETVRAGLDYLAGHGNASELVVVDDGSSDGSGQLLDELALKHSSLRLIRNGANRGKGHAVREGILHSRCERVVFTDADMAYPFGEIDKILAALDNGADVAVATRVDAESRYIMSPTFFGYVYSRHLGSRIFNRLVRMWLGLSTYDCQAGLKGFHRRAAESIFRLQTLNGFTFDVEVLFIAKRLHLTVSEVPVVFRYFSEPTTVSFIMDSMRALRDVARLRLNALRGLYG